MKLKPNLLSYLIFCLLILASSCSLFDKDDGDPGTTKLTSIETGPTVEVASSTIPTSGGTIKVSKPDTPVDGMEITIPANSFPSGQTFNISYSEIKSHDFGQYFNPISPMISIAYNGGYSSEPIEITIPITLPKGYFAMAFYLDGTTGKLEGLPVIKLSSSSITVATRHFMSGQSLSGEASSQKSASVFSNSVANMIISSISESVLQSATIISSGFTPGLDDWEFINRGSYLAPGGHCAGQSMTAMWYYYEKKLKGEADLFHQFDQLNDKTNPSFMAEDNPLGYRIASVIQEDFNFDGWINSLNFQSFLPGIVFKSFAASILVTGEPQFVLINNSAGEGGHAMIVYKVNFKEGKLYIADPNYPNNRESSAGNESIRTIDYVGDVLKPYETGLTAGDLSVTMDQIGYFGKTAYIDWSKIEKRWGELKNNTIGTVAPNEFPAYTIWVKDGAGYELKDGLIMAKDTLRSYIIGPNTAIGYHTIIAGKILLASYVYDQNGKRIDTQEGLGNHVLIPKEGLYVKLKPGLNKLGYYIVGWKNESKYTSGANNGKFKDKFIDFKWITVNYISSLHIIADPNPSQVNKEVKFTACTKKTAPGSAKYFWNFGDGTSVVSTVDSIATHTFLKIGNYNVKVELFDSSNNTKITEDVMNIEIKDPSSSMKFNFNFTKKYVNDYNGITECDYQLSGNVEVFGTNKIVSITQDANTKAITILMEKSKSKVESHTITFNCSFSNYKNSEYGIWYYPGANFKFMVKLLGLKDLKCSLCQIDKAGNGTISSDDGANYVFTINGQILIYEEWWDGDKFDASQSGEKTNNTPSFNVNVTFQEKN